MSPSIQLTNDEMWAEAEDNGFNRFQNCRIEDAVIFLLLDSDYESEDTCYLPGDAFVFLYDRFIVVHGEERVCKDYGTLDRAKQAFETVRDLLG